MFLAGRGSSVPRIPRSASLLFFSHTLGLLLYLSLMISPALRNPRLPQQQLLLIYPPVTEKRWLAARLARGRGCWARPRLR